MRITRSVRVLLFAMIVMATSALSFAQIGISIRIGPPILRVYQQPQIPAEGYLWTPGYWAYGEDGYFWVDGEWVLPPEEGLLWTPPYWGWGNDAYLFHEGYWGSSVGFYGGICYGFGYCGEGYYGGRWENHRFFYNREANNVGSVNIHNVYNERIIVNNDNRVSYNGGNGGVTARATPQQQAAEQGRHVQPVAAQMQHAQAARSNPAARAPADHGNPAPAPNLNHGNPGNNGNPNHNATNEGANPAVKEAGPRPDMTHPKDTPAAERPAPPNTGNPKRDQQYLRQQQSLSAKQDQQRQQMQQKQDRERQKMTQQKAPEAQTQQMEQRHQQQTQQMEQKHTQQQQQMQNKQQPRGQQPPKAEPKAETPKS